MPTPGRNDPCPCKSGKKFKKCCASLVDKARELKSGEDVIQTRDLQMMEFVQPLLDATGADLKSVKDTLAFGVICWRLAMRADTEDVEPDIATYSKKLTEKNPENFEACQDSMRKMIKRHRALFPEHHKQAAP